MTRYTDVVEVHAGPLTSGRVLFAKAFYAHRQRRLSRLVASGFDYAPVTGEGLCRLPTRVGATTARLFPRLSMRSAGSSTRSPSSGGPCPLRG